MQAAPKLEQRFELQTRRVFLGKWNCGPTPVTLKVDRQHPEGVLEFFPAENYALKGQYLNVLYDLGACTRFEVDKTNGTLCFWAIWEPPFMDLLGLDTYAPFVSQDSPESSLYIEYDKKPYEDSASHWPSQLVRLPPARAYRAIAHAPARAVVQAASALPLPPPRHHPAICRSKPLSYTMRAGEVV